MIAHRLPTIQNADQILVLEQGGIRERGTHQELLAAGELKKPFSPALPQTSPDASGGAAAVCGDGELLSPLLGGKEQLKRLAARRACGLLLVFIFILQLLQYRVTFLTAYEQSAKRRISPAEKLRCLPLSFFGKRDLAELSTMPMRDCTSLEAAFSHSIPELFAGLISVFLMGTGLLLQPIGGWHPACRHPFPCANSGVGQPGSSKKHEKKSLTAELEAANRIQECL